VWVIVSKALSVAGIPQLHFQILQNRRKAHWLFAPAAQSAVPPENPKLQCFRRRLPLFGSRCTHSVGSTRLPTTQTHFDLPMSACRVAASAAGSERVAPAGVGGRKELIQIGTLVVSPPSAVIVLASGPLRFHHVPARPEDGLADEGRCLGRRPKAHRRIEGGSVRVLQEASARTPL